MTSHKDTKTLDPNNDPNKFGPGLWWSQHRTAYLAKTKEEKKEFVVWENKQLNGIRCGTCRSHAQEYILTHPIEPFFIKEKGCFEWTWMFHNEVNKRLDKPIMDFNTAWGMYDNPDDYCNKDCGAEEPKHKEFTSGESYVMLHKPLQLNPLVRMSNPSLGGNAAVLKTPSIRAKSPLRHKFS